MNQNEKLLVAALRIVERGDELTYGEALRLIREALAQYEAQINNAVGQGCTGTNTPQGVIPDSMPASTASSTPPQAAPIADEAISISLERRLGMALEDAQIMKANWNAACDDIAELQDRLRAAEDKLLRCAQDNVALQCELGEKGMALAAAEQDAERYRWLRDNGAAIQGEDAPVEDYGLCPIWRSMETLDEGIDAAIDKERHK